MRSTITNIIDEDVIRCFQNRLFSKHTYHDFGRNHLTTVVELRDMMAWWADQEDEVNNRFPKRNHDKQSNVNGHFDKSQRNHSGIPESASQTMKSRLSSATCVARSQVTTTRNMRKSCTSSARYTQCHDTRSLSASPSASHSMHHLSPKQETKRTRRMMRKVKSRGLKTSRIRRMSSMSFSAETADSPPSARRS
jgi:hypothetical protein